MKIALDKDTLVLTTETVSDMFTVGQLSKTVPGSTVSSYPCDTIQKEIRIPVKELLRAAVN